MIFVCSISLRFADRFRFSLVFIFSVIGICVRWLIQTLLILVINGNIFFCFNHNKGLTIIQGGSIMHILYSALLAIFFYIAIIISYKIMGKREMSSLSIFDFVMNLIMADIVASGIVEEEFWLDAFVALVVLVLLQVTMARIQMRNPKVRKYVDGEPSMVINNGKIDFDELTKLRVQLDELMMLLRLHDVVNVDDIQYAIMEANGQLSIFEKRVPVKTFPLPFVISGAIKPSAIENAGLQEEWFYRQLKKHEILLNKDIKYIFYEEKQLIVYTKCGFKKYKLN